MKVKVKTPVKDSSSGFVPQQKQTSPNNGNKKAAPVQPTAAPQKKESFISKCINIIRDDINYHIHGIKTEDRQKWEDYERFLEMTRKGGNR